MTGKFGLGDRDRRVVLATVAPIVVAALLASWLLWARAHPKVEGGFCVNATVEFADILDRASGADNGGRGLAPDVPAILRAARTIDIDRLQVDTPEEIRADVSLLARASSAERLAGTERISPDVQAALARVLGTYVERCQ